MTSRNTPSLEIVTTPTERWLRDSLKTCQSRLLVASPYVNHAFAQVLDEVSSSVKTTLVTKTDLRDFAMGSSKLETLCDLADNGVRILSLSGLHAKVYVLDRHRALITSANATWSGMQSNWECGVAVSQKTAVRRVARLVLTGFGADSPPKEFSAHALTQLRPHVDALRSTMPSIPSVKVPDTPDALQDTPFQLNGDRKFVDSFTGWTRLTLEFVLSMSSDSFTLGEVYAGFTPIAERRYPGNKHVPDKIRQQLQRLRQIGLVEFLGNGEYRRTVKP